MSTIALFFWASPHNKEKEYIKTTYYSLVRERDKNAPLFDEMMRTTTT